MVMITDIPGRLFNKVLIHINNNSSYNLMIRFNSRKSNMLFTRT